MSSACGRRVVSSSRTDVLVDVTMPQMGVSVAEGTIISWSVDVGDRIEADAAICEISTDKIDTELPSPASGVVAEILIPVGETVPVGTVLARLSSSDDAAPVAEPTPPPSALGADGGTLSRMRRQIGEHMKRSLETAAHCTTWIEVDMGAVETARSRLGLTALPFVAAAVNAALREHPALNATL